MSIKYKNFFIKIFFLILVIPITLNLLSSKNIRANQLKCEDAVNIIKNAHQHDGFDVSIYDLDFLENDCKKLIDQNDLAEAYYILAVIYNEKVDIKFKEEYLLKSINKGYYEATCDAADLYFFGLIGDNYDQDIVDFEKVKKYVTIGSNNNIGCANYKLGYFYKYGEVFENDFDKAQKHLKLSADSGNVYAQLELIDLNSSGNYYQDLEKIIDTIDYINNQSINNTRPNEFVYYWASIYANAANDYLKAIDYANEVINLLTIREGKNVQNLAYDYGILAEAYESAGNYNLAIESIDEALRIHNYSGAREDSYLMQLFSQKARILLNANKKNEAYKVFFKIDNYYKNNPEDVFLADYSFAQFEISKYYFEKGDFQKSISYFNLAEKNVYDAFFGLERLHFRNVPIKIKILQYLNEDIDKYISEYLDGSKKTSEIDYAEALKIFSEEYFLSKNKEACIEKMEESIEIKRKYLTNDNINLLDSKNLLAKCFFLNNRNNEAVRIYEETLNVVLENNLNDLVILNPFFKDGFYNYLKIINDNNVNTNSAFNLISYLDSSDFSNFIREMIVKSNIQNEEIVNNLQKKETLRNQISGLRNDLTKIQLADEIDREQEKDIMSKIEEYSYELNAINDLFEDNYQELNFLLNNTNYSLEKIQEAIDINENIFLYTFYNEDLIILFVDQKNTDFRIIKNIKNDILLKIKNLRLLLEEPRSNISRFNVGYDLYKILIEPFESSIQFDDKITVISDDIISSIPFASLLDNEINGDNFSEQDFLIKKYGFSYLPSIESFYLLKNLKNTEYAKKFIGVGNPNFDNTFTQLPNTESEVKFISENFENNDTVLLLGNQANETLINTTNMDSEFMMFATHALKANEVENINEPAIVLSQNLGNSNDGYLTTSEILNQKFNSNLLILSACNTASPDLSGDYYSGLTRSFFYSGSKNMLTTKWAVETNSAELITTEFFKNNAKNFFEKLKMSQIQLLQDNNYSHPFYWSPYTIVGVN